jgi:hypothetical protein
LSAANGTSIQRVREAAPAREINSHISGLTLPVVEPSAR